MASGRRWHEDASSAALAALLAQAGASLVASTLADEVVVVCQDRGRLAIDRLPLAGAAGVGVAPGWLGLAGTAGIWELRDEPTMVTRSAKRRVDVAYVPRRLRAIGDRRARELFLGADGATWFVDPTSSCLITADPGEEGVVRWRLPAALPQHVDGVATSAGIPRYVTALGSAGNDGVLVEVDSGEVVAAHLALPRSPRLHDSRLWVLESAVGSLATVDRASGERTPVAGVPPFARGLAFAGHLAFVGLAEEGDAPGGVAVVDTRAGAVVAEARLAGVPGVLDLQVVPHRAPQLLELALDAVATAHLVPAARREPGIGPLTTPTRDPHLDRSTP